MSRHQHSQAEPRLHRFGPAHVNGAFGSPLSWLQVVVLLGGMYGAYRVFASTGVAGLLAALVLVLATCVIVFLPVRGRELIEWLPLILHATTRRMLGRHRQIGAMTTSGFRGRADDPAGGGVPPAVDMPAPLKSIEILEANFDRHSVGIIKDRAARTYAAVLKVRVGAFGLLSSDDQQRRVEAWSSLLTNLCREGTPISRVQWIERTIPTDPDELVRYHLTNRDPQRPKSDDVVASYESLINDSTAATQDHELFMVVQVSVRRAKTVIKRLADTIDEGACLLLQQELQTIAEALITCDIEPLGVLKARTLAKHIRLAYDPFQRRALDRMGAIDPGQDGVSAINAWPLASPAEWDHYQTDGAVHATYWVAEWPRRDVPAAFLLPLLLQANMQRSISVVMEPLEISKALSKVEAAIVGDQTSEHVRQSKGMRPRSLDVHLSVTSDATVGDLVADTDALDPAEIVEQMDLREQVEQHLRTLDPPSRRAVRLRYGLETGSPETISSIAQRMRLDPVEARRLTQRAMRTLQDRVDPPVPPPVDELEWPDNWRIIAREGHNLLAQSPTPQHRQQAVIA